MNYLEMKKINFYYQEAEGLVLQDFDLTVKKGEIIALLGESGCGKSTVLRLIAGLEKPVSGKIYLNQECLASQDCFVETESRGVGMVFQDYALFPHLSVLKNIIFGLKGMSAAAKKAEGLKMLALVRMLEHQDKKTYELSGGQQQRVALARSLCPKPKLILLDEPFSNLDSNLKADLRLELKRILQEAKMTSILVTHDEEDALALADRLIRF